MILFCWKMIVNRVQNTLMMRCRFCHPKRISFPVSMHHMAIVLQILVCPKNICKLWAQTMIYSL